MDREDLSYSLTDSLILSDKELPHQHPNSRSVQRGATCCITGSAGHLHQQAEEGKRLCLTSIKWREGHPSEGGGIPQPRRLWFRCEGRHHIFLN